jgi:hypothetical protein
MKSPSSDDKIKALKREIALRKRVYPLRVRAKLMQLATADHEIAVMQAILEDYERQQEPALI